jgi:transcriptional regulator with XRE-family HTH domain
MASAPPSSIGLARRALRLARGLSMTSLAARAGVHRNSLARWERGLPVLSDTAARLAEHLGCTAGEYVDGIAPRLSSDDEALE